MLLASQVLLWIVVLLLSGVVFALARQIGVLHERIAPVGALTLNQGPKAGDAAPKVEARALDGSVTRIGGGRQLPQLQMLLFVAPDCPICKQIIPTAKRVAEVESIDLLLAGDGDTAELRRMATRFAVPEDRFLNSSELGRAFQVGKLPYAVLLDPRGSVVSLGLVNSREHLESLISVRDTGFASVQDYLQHLKSDGRKADLEAITHD